MKKRIRNLVVALLFVMFSLQTFMVHASNTLPAEMPYTKSQCELEMKGRQLWADHVSWTRSYIISAIASLEDKDAVLERLLKNQDEIGAYIKPFYGEDAGNQLASLLREHIKLAGQVLEAAKEKNTAEFEKYNKLWHENADQIAALLSTANPNLDQKELQDMLYKHLQFLTDQVVARLNNNWSADIKAYDEGELHMLHFADMIANAIVKQFPEKFK